MVNYNYGKIYKIEPITGGESGDVYVGSTAKKLLSQRMSSHRSGYKRWKAGAKYNLSSFILFEKYGVENCQIVLLELVNVNIKDELIAREKHYIQTMECVNRNVAGRTKLEYYRETREVSSIKKAEYYQKNKEIIGKKKAVYRQGNKESISIKGSEFYQNNKEVILKRVATYTEKNKEDIAKKNAEYRKNNRELLAKRSADNRLKKKQDKLNDVIEKLHIL